MKRITTFLLSVTLLLTGAAHGYDFLTSRGTSLGQATLLSNPTPSDLLNLPSGSLKPGEWRFETGLNRAFDLKDFDQLMLSGAGRFGRFSVAAGFSQFGRSELYTEQIAKLAVAAHLDSLTLGIGVSHLLVGFGGDYGDLGATALHAGSAFRYRSWYLAIGADNMNSPVLSDGSPKALPFYQVNVEYCGKRPVSILGRMRFQNMERPRFTLGQHIRFGEKAALMLGIISAPVQFGGGFEFTVKGGRISYGASVHPVLGLSQTLSISFGNRSPKPGDGHEFK